MRHLPALPNGGDQPVSRTFLRLTGLHATGAVVRQVRERLVSWVRQTGLDEDQVADVGLAAHEAMANVIDHAYEQPGGVFDLYAFTDEDTVTVTVTDRGNWKRTPQGRPTLRGRGLLIIRQLTRQFELTAHAHGTIVRMTWRTRSRPPLRRA
ncbi:ATP-binding protein [Labedaea rhizosphaerae]|uniref:ATP-binding protein n=1 Tax=Labedaea rhizosphaerae TaxID=598644 RepID=UPI001415107C|nr:ATP-binding protein [Labedaea rhizosphaerae]